MNIYVRVVEKDFYFYRGLELMKRIRSVQSVALRK